MKSVRRHKRRTRCGRGPASGLGKTSGKGNKGQNARNKTTRPLFEGGQMQLFRRLPKRGFSNALFHKEYVPINVGSLNVFDNDTVITPALLREHGIVKRFFDGKHIMGIKILGNGEITKKISVQAQGFSESAKKKIEAAGGTTLVVPAAGKAAVAATAGQKSDSKSERSNA